MRSQAQLWHEQCGMSKVGCVRVGRWSSRLLVRGVSEKRPWDQGAVSWVSLREAGNTWMDGATNATPFPVLRLGHRSWGRPPPSGAEGPSAGRRDPHTALSSRETYCPWAPPYPWGPLANSETPTQAQVVRPSVTQTETARFLPPLGPCVQAAQMGGALDRRLPAPNPPSWPWPQCVLPPEGRQHPE